MKENILTSRLHRQYKKIIKSLCFKHSDLENKGVLYIDDFLTYIHQCHVSIRDKVSNGVSSKTNKNKYEKRFQEFNFRLHINLDLSCTIGVDLIQTSTYSFNNGLLKSYYLKDGFVYFLESDFGYKIGCTNDINRRFKELKTLMPFQLKLHSFIEFKKYEELERILHKSFEDKRINGEWFNLRDEDFEYIDEICRIYKTDRVIKNNEK